MRGNINLGDKIYKITSKSLSAVAHISINSENVKIPLKAKVTIQKNKKVSINVKAIKANRTSPYHNLDITYTIQDKPIEAKNQPLTEERINIQLTKTSSTPYKFSKLEIDLGKNLFLPKISSLNELRRGALKLVKEYATSQITRNSNSPKIEATFGEIAKEVKTLKGNKKRCADFEIALNLNTLNLEEDYSKLLQVDSLYIPLIYFSKKKYEKVLKTLSSKFNLYISLPTIIKSNYKNILYENIEKSIKTYHIKGFVLSNISNIIFLENIRQMHVFDFDLKDFDLVANYTFNVFNHLSVEVLKKMGLNTYTISPELDNKSISYLCGLATLKKELIVYGRIPVINTNYCVLGNSNKCYPDCKALCTSKNKYYLQDRMKARFPVVSDNVQAVTTIYNYQNQSISPLDFNIDIARIDILYESVDEINKIIKDHLELKEGF